MQNRSRLLLAGLLVGINACDADSSTSESTADDTARAAQSSPPPLPPETWTDSKGRTWVRQGPMQCSEPGIPAEDAGEDRPRMVDMTVDEIAMRIRPVTSFWNYVYMVEEPNYSEAERIKSGEQFPAITFPQEFPQGYEASGEQGASGGDVPDLPPIAVIGVDQRIRISANTTGPYSAVGMITKPVNLTNPPEVRGVSCTTSLIGASTAISVAHCYLGRDPQTFTANNGWAYGVDRLDANPYPFGAWTGCFFVFFTTAAWDAGASGVGIEDDYAVIEYSDLYPGGCNLYPGNSTGYLGWGTTTDTFVESGFARLAGYPEWTSARSYDWPSMWYYATANSDGQSDRIVHYVDSTEGQSGGPLYFWTGSGYMVAGVQSRGNSTSNKARRIDGTFFNFICAYGDMGC